MNTIRRAKGFTLLELLIALFIFTILSLILTNALHNVISVEERTDKNAERLRDLQIALVMLSRDVEQAINRPIINANGKEDPAFRGTTRGFTFTHTGSADASSFSPHSALKRSEYDWNEESLGRKTWAVLDQAPQSTSHTRILLTDVTAARFDYLDKEGEFHESWPLESNTQQSLPRAVRVSLTISNWGNLTQLYVISAEASKNNQPPPPPKS